MAGNNGKVVCDGCGAKKTRHMLVFKKRLCVRCVKVVLRESEREIQAIEEVAAKHGRVQNGSSLSMWLDNMLEQVDELEDFKDSVQVWRKSTSEVRTNGNTNQA